MKKTVFIEKEMGRFVEEEIGERLEEVTLFVAIPNCYECRRRIENAFTGYLIWERVIVGHPSSDGATVYFFYDREEHKDKDMRKYLSLMRERLKEMGYYVY